MKSTSLILCLFVVGIFHRIDSCILEYEIKCYFVFTVFSLKSKLLQVPSTNGLSLVTKHQVSICHAGQSHLTFRLPYLLFPLERHSPISGILWICLIFQASASLMGQFLTVPSTCRCMKSFLAFHHYWPFFL